MRSHAVIQPLVLQKALHMQYRNDVFKLQERNDELTSYVEELQEMIRRVEEKAQLDALQRDYDEFKQPDIDGDDRISRAEFNLYVNNYIRNNPGLAEVDYPKWDDFDHDRNGYVSFAEYTKQMARHLQQAAETESKT